MIRYKRLFEAAMTIPRKPVIHIGTTLATRLCAPRILTWLRALFRHTSGAPTGLYIGST
jgi:hypothetical protein